MGILKKKIRMKISSAVLIGLASPTPIELEEVSELNQYLIDCSALGCSDGFSCWNGESCISDSDCRNMSSEKNVIFNHFYENSNGELQLIAECRSIAAEPTAGFTCGNDPSLLTGTEVFIPKRIVQRRRDERKTTILRQDQHLLLQGLLKEHSEKNCHGQCTPINVFDKSNCDGVEVNDLVHFPNAFNYGEDCMPVDSAR